MLLKYFDVTSEEVEMKDGTNNPNYKYTQCGYSWKKDNFE